MFVSEATYQIPATGQSPDPLLLRVAAHIPKAEKPAAVGKTYTDFIMTGNLLAGRIKIFSSPTPLSHEQAAVSTALLIADEHGPASVTPVVARRLQEWAHVTAADSSLVLPPRGSVLRDPDDPLLPYELPGPRR